MRAATGARGASRRRGLGAALLTLGLLSLPSGALADSGGGGLSATPAAIAHKLAVALASDRRHVYPGDSSHLGDRVLKAGTSGHDVRVLQAYLTKDGYGVRVTGAFGSTTRSQVVAFQGDNGLRTNGLVTWSVSQALRRAVGAPALTTHVSTTPAMVPTAHGQIIDGLAVAPAGAPATIKAVIASGNKIASYPYVYGGGHGSFHDTGYDCSGSVSYALHGGNLISSPEDSSELESYGSGGAGRWITIWANSGHTFMYVAGLRFDTSAQGETGGSRWTTHGRGSDGYVERHPTGY